MRKKTDTEIDRTLKIIREVQSLNAKTLANSFHFLQINLLCNLFVLNHPEMKLKFPIRGDKGMFSGSIGGDDNIQKKTKNYNSEIKGIIKRDHISYFEYIDKKFNALVYNGEDFENIDVKDKESFKKVYDYLYIVEMLFHKKSSETKIEKSIDYENPCFFLSIDAAQKYFELIGYWTAKQEQRRNNPGGIAMKNRGERNKEIIKKLLEDLKIKSLDFGTNTELRNKFYNMSKQLTDLTSEDRIQKIARPFLNG